MRAHFDCLAEIETSHGSLTDNTRLREALRQNAFLLGLEACKNKNNAMELGFIKRKEEQMRLEKSEL